jgi:hypothetical protein
MSGTSRSSTAGQYDRLPANWCQRPPSWRCWSTRTVPKTTKTQTKPDSTQPTQPRLNGHRGPACKGEGAGDTAGGGTPGRRMRSSDTRAAHGTLPVQRVLSNDLWAEVRKQARASKSRKSAIANHARSGRLPEGRHLGRGRFDHRHHEGRNGCAVVAKLHKKGVRLYDCADPHAKILLLDDVAIIGSGNMSSSSEKRMVEAALISDQGSVVAGVASPIEQLVKQSSPLDKKADCTIVQDQGGPTRQMGCRSSSAY